MRWRFMALLALAAVATLAACAHAHEDEGTKELGYGEYVGVEVENDHGGSVDIFYDVTVDSGPGVDVFFMDDTDYSDVQAGRGFEYYIVFSVEDTLHAKREWTWSEEGVFYVVVINLNESLENATVTYSIGHEEVAETPSMLLWVLGAAVVIVVAILLFVLLTGRRRVAEAATPQAEGAGTASQGTEPRPPPGPHPPPPPLGPYAPPPPPGG